MSSKTSLTVAKMIGNDAMIKHYCKWQITPRKLLNVKWGYNFGQTLEWIEWAKYMFQRYKYWWLVVMSFHCSPTHSTPCDWHGLPDLIPKHLGPKPLGQPMDDPLGPNPMNDLFARFYCIGLKRNTQNMCWIMKNDSSICRKYLCKCKYLPKTNKHNVRRPCTTVRQSIYTILTLYLQLIYVYIYMFLSTTMIPFYVCIYLTTLTTIPVWTTPSLALVRQCEDLSTHGLMIPLETWGNLPIGSVGLEYWATFVDWFWWDVGKYTWILYAMVWEPPIMEVDGRWFSFSIGRFLASKCDFWRALDPFFHNLTRLSQTKTSTVSTNSFSHNHGSETWIPPVVVSFDVG